MMHSRKQHLALRVQTNVFSAGDIIRTREFLYLANSRELRFCAELAGNGNGKWTMRNSLLRAYVRRKYLDMVHCTLQAIENHKKMIKEMRGVPGVKPDRFEEAFTVRYCNSAEQQFIRGISV